MFKLVPRVKQQRGEIGYLMHCLQGLKSYCIFQIIRIHLYRNEMVTWGELVILRFYFTQSSPFLAYLRKDFGVKISSKKPLLIVN